VYFYIYDEFVQNKRFEKELLQIENRLTDLGIAGKVARLALFRDVEEMVRDELRRGVTSVIVVGNDTTVRRVLDVLVEHRVTLGMIPLGEPGVIANVFGLPVGLPACDVLSARILETVDAGMINGKRFLTSVSIPKFSGSIAFGDAYRAIVDHPASVSIRNVALSEPEFGLGVAHPCDGSLETVVRVQLPRGWKGMLGGKKIGVSVLPTAAMTLKSEEPVILTVDGEEMGGSRFDVSVEPGILKVITGKGRLFGDCAS